MECKDIKFGFLTFNLNSNKLRDSLNIILLNNKRGFNWDRK